MPDDRRATPPRRIESDDLVKLLEAVPASDDEDAAAECDCGRVMPRTRETTAAMLQAAHNGRDCIGRAVDRGQSSEKDDPVTDRSHGRVSERSLEGTEPAGMQGGGSSTRGSDSSDVARLEPAVIDVTADFDVDPAPCNPTKLAIAPREATAATTTARCSDRRSRALRRRRSLRDALVIRSQACGARLLRTRACCRPMSVIDRRG